MQLVTDSNAFVESLFRTAKYRPEFPAKGFADLLEARQWARLFVSWYNNDHKHSGIRYVSPAQRHAGKDRDILVARHEVYLQARAAHTQLESDHRCHAQPRARLSDQSSRERRSHNPVCRINQAATVLTRTVTLKVLAEEDHVVVSPRGGSFSTAIDAALSAVGVTRRVALSAASFLFVPELIARSDLIAFVPSRLVHHRANRLAIFEPPIKVPGFAISLLWHDRTHDHPAHAWVRSKIAQWL